MHLYALEYGMLGNQGVVGSGIPHAVGAAFSAQYRGTSQVAVSFFGDGAANVGSFHEGLHLAYEQARKEGRLGSLADLQAAIRYGAVQRLRPKFMTVATTFLGLVPILWSIGFGSDVMKRIAAPMIGGILTSFLLELVVYPPIYQV
jgi:Cu/Ag efflux pump CusA